MSYEPMKIITANKGTHINGDWVAYATPSQVTQIGVGATRELALENLALTLSQKLDIIISLREGLG